MQKITPFLWFNGRAEEAVQFYTSVFKNSSIKKITYWDESSPFPPDQVMTAEFELDGKLFYAFDAGPAFSFNEAISFYVDCDGQEEVDYYWEKLSEGGNKSQCGWLKDKFGVSWQIIPKVLPRLMQDEDPSKRKRVMAAMMKMSKIIVRDIEEA